MQYSPLNTAQGGIRLIKLSPVTPDGENTVVECVLEHASLVNPPPFIALSYLWGDTRNTLSINVGTYTFQATHNLAHALLSLRDCGVERV